MQTFELGVVLVSVGVKNETSAEEIKNALLRHMQNDWGEYADDCDRRANVENISKGESSVVSRYRHQTQSPFCIVTYLGKPNRTMVILSSEWMKKNSEQGPFYLFDHKEEMAEISNALEMSKVNALQHAVDVLAEVSSRLNEEAH